LTKPLYKANIVYNRISPLKTGLFLQITHESIADGDDAANLRPEIGNIFKNYSLRCFKSEHGFLTIVVQYR